MVTRWFDHDRRHEKSIYISRLCVTLGWSDGWSDPAAYTSALSTRVLDFFIFISSRDEFQKIHLTIGKNVILLGIP
jgi:hypothetical protein